MILKDAYVKLDSNDISAYCMSVTVNTEAATQDSHTMGDNWTEVELGLKSWSLELELKQSFASSELDSILWPYFNNGSTIAVEFRPTSSAASASNPKWTGNAVLASYSPLSGSVGDLASTSITLTGVGAITRAIS